MFLLNCFGGNNLEPQVKYNHINSNPASWNYDPHTGKPLGKEVAYLCLASLACWLLGNFLLLGDTLLSRIFGAFYTTVLMPSSGLFIIAAYVIDIIAVVRYPKNIFSKVLLAIYILEIVLIVIAIIATVVFCISIIPGCYESFQGCLSMG